MAAVNPYLNFDGKCEEAFNFYNSVFGAGPLQMMKFNSMPEGVPAPEGGMDGNRILHVAMPLGKGTILMGSDSPSSKHAGIVGDNFAVSVAADSEEEATKIFNGLSAGGKVTMPLGKTFWGAFFGMFTDKFGVNWMVNYDYPRE